MTVWDTSQKYVHHQMLHPLAHAAVFIQKHLYYYPEHVRYPVHYARIQAITNNKDRIEWKPYQTG